MKMYKKVYMRLSYIYDTAFCNNFDNIKSNHIVCDMTDELKNILKKYILLRLTRFFWVNQQMEAEGQCGGRIQLPGLCFDKWKLAQD